MESFIGIVIVNYNGEKFQNDCIRSILATDYDNYKIIVVDNASSDKSIAMLNEFCDDRILVLPQGKNYGVAKGNNIGILKSIELGCTHTLLLNNDTEVSADFLRKLLECEEDLVSPKIYYFGTKTIWYAGGKFSRLKGNSYHLHYKEPDSDLIHSGYFDYAPTCCLLVKNTVFQVVGLMDEKYFLYCDDTDFCYRAKLKGFRIWLCNGSIIFHKVSLSTGGENSPLSLYYANRNRLYFIHKFKFGFFTKCFYYLSRRAKIIKSKMKATDDGYYIKLAIKDCKKGNMYRKDNLGKGGKKK